MRDRVINTTGATRPSKTRIEQLHDDSVKFSMNLLKITHILIISLIASFSMRVVGTLFPVIFQDSYIVRITTIIYAFSVLMQLLFFIYFLSSFTKDRELPLKVVSFLAILGSFAVALIYIKNVGIVFEVEILQRFLINKYITAAIPLVNSLFQLLFFMVFKNVLADDEQINLSRPILAAIIGAVSFVVIHLFVFLKFTRFPIFDWLEQMLRFVTVWTLPLIGLAAILLLYFYISFYRYISSMDIKE